MIDPENLNGDKATSYEKKMYRKIQTLEDQAINVSKNLVLKDTKAYKDQSEEKQAYASYVYTVCCLEESIDLKFYRYDG